MTTKRFNEIAKEQLNRDEVILTQKGTEYSLTEDRLVNFKHGAMISGWSEQNVLFGYLLKHLTSLIDMINSDDSFTRSLWVEKLGDIRNYTILLLAVLEDTNKFKNEES